jgi:hypothetical protein
MRISEDTVDRAFAAFHKRYVDKESRAWDLNHHGRLWADARASVESANDDEGFVRTLVELRSHWQLARGRGSEMMEFPSVLPMLRKHASSTVNRPLSSLVHEDARGLLRIIDDVSHIKRVQGKPSLMAISKVLHFFNPRLFVIVDRGMMWDWALSHTWIWEPMESVRVRVDRAIGCESDARDDSACDSASYVAILIACAELLRQNPHIQPQFALFLRGHTNAEARLPHDLERYEAAAVEWLLLGLVELPPAGVAL